MGENQAVSRAHGTLHWQTSLHGSLGFSYSWTKVAQLFISIIIARLIVCKLDGIGPLVELVKNRFLSDHVGLFWTRSSLASPD